MRGPMKPSRYKQETGEFDYGGPDDSFNGNRANISIWVSPTVRIYYLEAFGGWGFEDTTKDWL